jgi:phosphotriesterase-related protein
MNFSRREFLVTGLGFLLLNGRRKEPYINTVSGSIPSAQLGKTLIHEHFLVDFIGADKINFDRWNRAEVIEKVLPYLLEVKQAGVKSIFDCTPDFLGRDVVLLKMLAEQSGIQIITNTGYYGAVGNKYLPQWAYSEAEEQLAKRWSNEFKKGITGTSVKPGFIKIGVDADGPLSELHKKLVRAAAITHLKTGLTICSHTGPARGALEQIEILQAMDVHPEAFVWVHAQNESDKTYHVKAARLGAWISLDGIGWGDFENYADSILRLKNEGLLGRVLISHDAGWYKPGEASGREFKGYTNIFNELLPRLRQKGFSESDFDTLLLTNPAEAMSIRIRKS